MFENIIAPNPKLNATVMQGNSLVGQIIGSRVSATPRLYANEISGTSRAGMVPANNVQDNSDLPNWAASDSPSLQDQGVPPDLAIYLQVWIPERGNFYDVAGVLDRLDAGATLDQALN